MHSARGIHRLRYKLSLLLLLSFIGGLLPATQILASNPVNNHQSHLVLVTHPSNHDRNLKFQTLRAIYSMRMQTWPDGDPIQVFVLPDNSQAHKLFCKELLRTLPRHLRKNWDRLVFSGIAQAPSAVTSTTAMKQKIANTPGAIGYIAKEDIDDSVAIVTID